MSFATGHGNRRGGGFCGHAPATRAAVLAALVVAAVATVPAEARKKRPSRDAAPAAPQEQQERLPEPQPYKPKITRLAEILGALTYLDELCAPGRSTDWRGSMKALMEAQARTDPDRDELAGAFNRGYRGYRITYRTCTTNAWVAMSRFLGEGKRIAREVVDRYGSS